MIDAVTYIDQPWLGMSVMDTPDNDTQKTIATYTRDFMMVSNDPRFEGIKKPGSGRRKRAEEQKLLSRNMY